ncbi:MAG: 2-dehydropantoate 2-reductase [Gammaproteobacteria bacterium]|nr:2-dehydropantoate 2-reductase [Gammaproteobacteria bacterium]MBU1504846.1 2-dehydropantoate 2-reductase [Gammaproteobacteria bacterium]MBU2122443.1 2-dehydropantoate 2-reductase [Gammaproteobacteria bacterium]MBU2172111.1 2-dehydropantoate 2-reductase [Gammaproteobacteria bacterium]MBU2198855.1 2-dehydropantoate 2-reductase [Gammaproteobacteria bacterium]
MAPHFIVLGAGAIGCYVGGRLAAHGQSVCLVGRPHALEPISLQGLQVTDLDGFDRHVPASALQRAHTLADAAPGAHSVVLLCVKSGATDAAARELAAGCAPGTPVISLQNGVDNVARVAALAPGLNVLAGMVPYNVVLRGAHVHRATAGHLQLQRDAVTERIAPVFDAAGLATVLPADIRAVQWGKLLLNLNNPVNALSDLPLRQELLDRDCRRVFAALQTEALHVMARAGITPAQVTAVSPTLLPHVLRLPNWLFTSLAKRMLQMDAKARSSMWDDLETGRVTEIDALSGAVVRLAMQHGMQAPLNARMCELLGGPRQRLTGPQMRQRLGV